MPRLQYTPTLLTGLLFLSVVFIPAGGLGLAASAGLIGLLIGPLILVPTARSIRAAPLGAALGAATLIWLALSLSWSPYNKPDQALKLVLLTPLFALTAYLGVRLTHAEAARKAWLLCVLCLIAGGYFIIEATSGGMLGAWIEFRVEGSSEFVLQALHRAKITLSRGATAFLMLAGPLSLWLWRRQSALARGLAVMLIISGGVAAIAFEVEANIVAAMMGALVVAAALHQPRFVAQLLLTVIAVFILAAPLLMAAGLALLPENASETLPPSWAWRVEIWRAVLEQISAAPLFGHGLDSMRVMSDPGVIQGFEIERLPMHAHNAGLQIWVETGLVGAALCAATLMALAYGLDLAPLNTDQLTGLAYVGTVWFVTVTLGYGLWQEWHHGALALGCFAACLNRNAPDA